MHLLMLTEAAISVLAGMFLAMTSPVIPVMILLFLSHDITALWDGTYAVMLRDVTLVESRCIAS